MNIPLGNDSGWLDLIQGKKTLQFQALSTRILVSRIILEYKTDPTEKNKNRCIEQILEYFKKNVHMPSVQADLNSIFGGKRS